MGDITHATSCGVPASTARGWLARDAVEVITHPSFLLSDGDPRERLARLELRLTRLTALLRIALAILSVLRSDLTRLRVPDGRDKCRLLRAIDRDLGVRNLTRMLRVIGLSLPG